MIHSNAEFETLKSDILIENHYKSLLTSKDELDRKMHSGGKSISGSKGRTVEPLWRHMVEFEKQKRKLHIFSLTATPLKYEKDVKGKQKISDKDDSNDDDEEEEEEEDDEDEDYNDDKVIIDRERKLDKKFTATTTTTATTTSWPFCDNCECVIRICRALGNDDEEEEA